jgi:hypothetical protein
MADDQKIWFIYLTDHHEGPFTVAEVAQKAKQGLVNGQSLAWKDGMAEWVAAETIPELKPAFDSGPSIAAQATAAADSGDFSLAQMLASSQGAAAAPAAGADPVMAAPVQESPSALTSVSSLSAITGSHAAPAAGEPGANKEVWTLKIGNQVSGLHSLQRLIQLASEGEIPADAMLWHPGWTDFQSVSSVSQVASARKSGKTGATQLTKTGMMGGAARKPGGLAPITAGANVGDDEPTDPAIQMDPDAKGFKKILQKFKGLGKNFGKIKDLLKRKPKAGAAGAAPSAISAVLSKTGKTASVAAPAKKAGVGGKLKRILLPLVLVLVLGGAGAAYFLFFASPLPSDLDVALSDLESMTEVVKQDASQPRIFAAIAKGTEENPADETNPKFYVASNLPEGTQITLTLVGEPGTLVNKIRFDKSFTASVGPNRLAVFDQIKDDGKPLPMGDYKMKITADGAQAIEEPRFLGGKKGAVYDRRLKQYKEKLQGEYDKEMAELRQFVDTLKAQQAEVSKKISEYKTGWSNPSARNKLGYDWKAFNTSFQGLAAQFDAKVKERMNATGEEKYHPRAYQDISTTLAQLIQLTQLHTTRVEGGTPASSPDEVEGLVQAGVVSLEQWVAAAVVKSPFDAIKESSGLPPGGAAPPADPSAAPPATPVAPAAPAAAPAASGAAPVPATTP